jgi:hypothetical protein
MKRQTSQCFIALVINRGFGIALECAALVYNDAVLISVPT